MLEIFQLALHNIRRDPLRKAMTLSGLAIFVLIFILVSSFAFTMQSTVSASLSDLGGEITVWSQDALVPFLGSIPENYTIPIKELTFVKSVSPQITEVTNVDSLDLKVTLGVNPSDIPAFYTYTMVEGVMVSSNDSRAAMGYLFANFLTKHVGDNVTINGHPLPLVGVYKTDTWIDNAVIVPFKIAQDIFSKQGRASIVMVTVTDPSKIDSVVEQIRREMPNVSVFKSQEATTRLTPIMNSVTWISYALSTIIGITCFFGITNVTVTGIFERTKEIGILKAIGARSIDVTKMILYESAMLGVLGGLAGGLVSMVFLFLRLQIPIASGSALQIMILPENLVYGLILSVAVSILASLYPVWKAVHVRPNEVLRFG